MTFKELFHIRKSDQKIRLDDKREEDQIVLKDPVVDECVDLFAKNTTNEWNQEYELIYLSYVLER